MEISMGHFSIYQSFVWGTLATKVPEMGSLIASPVICMGTLRPNFVVVKVEVEIDESRNIDAVDIK